MAKDRVNLTIEGNGIDLTHVILMLENEDLDVTVISKEGTKC